MSGDIQFMANNDEKIIYRRNVIWNSVAGLINAAEAVVVLAVVSRINGLRDAGILTLAFSVANLFMTIGKFGMKNYQVAHDGDDYFFKTFLTSRFITVGVMILITVIYVVYNFYTYKFTAQKSLVIFFVCMWYAVEAFEDVFAGKYQAIGRLDIGSKIFSVRWFVTIVSFIVSDIIFKNIVIASVNAFVICSLLGTVFIIYTYFKYVNSRKVNEDKGIKILFRESMALCISAFLYFYITNIPKYAINSFLEDEVQAIYGYISMPVFVISLLNSFIYQPQLTAYILEWKGHQIKQFSYRIIRQMIIIFGIMGSCLFGACILGIPVLSILYHENLSAYKVHLLILILGGGFLALGGFMESMLVIIDKQKQAMTGYLVTAIFGYVLINVLVKKYQMLGAVCGYTLTMFLMTVIVCCFLVNTVQKGV